MVVAPQGGRFPAYTAMELYTYLKEIWMNEDRVYEEAFTPEEMEARCPPMIEGHYYFCYKFKEGDRWEAGQLIALRYSGLHGPQNRPLYVVVDPLDHPGPALVVPWYDLGEHYAA